jgi:PAS domain S-box-containing protein
MPLRRRDFARHYELTMSMSSGHLRTTVEAIAAGSSLDEALQRVAAAVAEQLGAGACRVWLVKPGDMCASCAMAASCHDRSLCLHLKAALPARGDELPRAPLVVFRNRIASRGGVARAAEAAAAGRILFGAAAADLAGGALVALPLKGPAGVVGLLAAVVDVQPTREQFEAAEALANAAVVAIRIADLTSRFQRATLRLEERGDAAAEVVGLLHAILYGSTEYDVLAEDLEGNITVFSEGARTTYGYSPDEVIGRVKADVLYAPEEVESGKIVEVLNEAMRTGRCEAIVTRIRKNGERFPARATFTVRRDADADPCGFVIVERDLSAERNSARLSETAAQQVAQLQDHLHALKATHAMLERDAEQLGRENRELRERLAHLAEIDDLNAIRSELIRDLRARLVAAEADANSRVAAEAGPGGGPPLVAFSHEIGAASDAVLGAASTIVDGRRVFAFSIRRDGVKE